MNRLSIPELNDAMLKSLGAHIKLVSLKKPLKFGVFVSLLSKYQQDKIVTMACSHDKGAEINYWAGLLIGQTALQIEQQLDDDEPLNTMNLLVIQPPTIINTKDKFDFKICFLVLKEEEMTKLLDSAEQKASPPLMAGE